MRGRRAAAVVLVLLAGACSSGSDGSASRDEASSTTSGTSSTTTTVDYEGDPDSEFCRRLATADDDPVLDPFEAGLDPGEVEVRFRALQLRFGELAAVAPPELEQDLDDLVEALDALGDGLEEAGYDFTEMAERGADVSAFDDASFADASARISVYRQQVCDQAS